MAALPSNRVKQGFWIDYTHGSVLGATITTTSTNANFIIAVLSVLVAFTGSHLWDLVAFACYWSGVSQQPCTAFRHQLQILARNVTSPGVFFVELTKVGWKWRKRSKMTGLIVMAAFSLLCSVGFLVAGIFVSQIVSTSGLHVLARSDSCGWLPWRNETTGQHREYQQLIFNQALVYARTCYDKSAALSQCNIFVKQAVPLKSITHTDCPFNDICANDSALEIDTGLLDSNDVFGINTPADFRVRMQRIVTCAPIDADRYMSSRPIPSDYLRRFEDRESLPEEQLFEWFRGPLIGASRPFNSTVWQSNYSASFSNTIALTPRAYYSQAKGNFINDWQNSTFDPIPEFRRQDADTHIIAIQNIGIRFYAQNDDPLFAAHNERHVFFDNGSNLTLYTADKPASFLGCAEQMRFCFTRGECTQLLGAYAAYGETVTITPTTQQSAILHYLFFQTPSLYWVSRSPMLVTRNADSFELGVPSNQWEAEIEAWMRFLVTVTQTTITHIAAGPGIVRFDFDKLTEPLIWPDFCNSQRMGAPDGYSNVSVFGLAFVVALSGTIVLINVSLVPSLKYMYRTNRLSSLRMKAWIQGSILQVQRKAYEGAGYSGWEFRESSVPILKTENLIPSLGIEVYPTRIDIRLPRTNNARSQTM